MNPRTAEAVFPSGSLLEECIAECAMSQLESFLEAIHESPDDDTPRLIFADWLDENGDAAGVPAASARAELIRVQCALAAWVPDHERRARLQARESELLIEHSRTWVPDLPDAWADWSFHRGLLQARVAAPLFVSEQFARAVEPALRAGWIDRMHLSGLRGYIAGVAFTPLLRWITALDLCNEGITDPELDILTRAPHWQRLRQLALRNNNLYSVPGNFADDRKWPLLEWLDLSNNFIPQTAGIDLVRVAGERLGYLDLQGNPLGAAYLEWIARRRQEPVPSRDGLPVRLVNSVGMEFVLIPAGSFLMGSPATEAERGAEEGPQHVVHITRPFYLSIYPVTREQYGNVMHEDPSSFQLARFHEPTARIRVYALPVETVTWDNTLDFCRRLSGLPEEAGRTYRLPTEAEWEYDCRAGTMTAFHCGGSLSFSAANFDGTAPYAASIGAVLERPSLVGSYAPNAFGLYDMHGNVWEWCQDWYDAGYYARSPECDPQGPESSPDGLRVVRGGSWVEGGRSCRSACRGRVAPRLADDDLGFRVVMEV
jgi:uncharacterized protein (TIGR02996 family)